MYKRVSLIIVIITAIIVTTEWKDEKLRCGWGMQEKSINNRWAWEKRVNQNKNHHFSDAFRRHIVFQGWNQSHLIHISRWTFRTKCFILFAPCAFPMNWKVTHRIKCIARRWRTKQWPARWKYTIYHSRHDPATIAFVNWKMAIVRSFHSIFIGSVIFCPRFLATFPIRLSNVVAIAVHL